MKLTINNIKPDLAAIIMLMKSQNSPIKYIQNKYVINFLKVILCNNFKNINKNENITASQN